MLLLLIFFAISLEVSSEFAIGNLMNCDEMKNNYDYMMELLDKFEKGFDTIVSWAEFGAYIANHFELGVHAKILE